MQIFFCMGLFREIGVPKIAHAVEAKILQLRKNDRVLTPPKITRGLYNNGLQNDSTNFKYLNKYLKVLDFESTITREVLTAESQMRYHKPEYYTMQRNGL